MIPLTLQEVADAVGGALVDAPAEAAVTGPVVVDSRLVEPGGLFAAVHGERVDGHDFAPAAVRAGAVAALATRPVGAPAVVVPDVVEALGRLAREVLRRSSAVVVGVTGSSGKTSTKDLIASLLHRVGPTVAPAGSFNNEIGLPLTVLRTDRDTRHLVLEYSARGVGHIAYLTGIAPPRVGVALNVGSAHLGEFGSREAIATAKSELVQALPGDGLAVLNADQPLVAGMAERTVARTVTFGLGDHADVQAHDVRLDERGRPTYRLVVPAAGVDTEVRLAGSGEHQVANSLAAAAVALELGLPGGDLAEALAEARVASRWRMEVTDRPDGITVVNDAYNANPESVRAALRALMAIGRGGARPRRVWAVLGEMLELGPTSGEEHEAIGRLAVRLGVDRLVVVGEGAARIHAGAVHEGSWGEESVRLADASAATELLRRELAPGDVVLVKASRSVGLERIAEALLADGAEGAQ